MRSKLFFPLLCASIVALISDSRAATTNVVQIGNYFFNPTNLTINVGDTIKWTNGVANGISSNDHETTRTNLPFQWASPLLTSSSRTFLLTFTQAGSFFYYCDRHYYASVNPHKEQTGTVSVVSANLSPSVSITNPANNAKFRAPTNLLLQATASDSDGSVTNVQFFSSGNFLGSDTALPYSFTASNLVAGNYAFTARAVDNLGAATTSAVVNVFVLTNAFLSAPQRLVNGQFRFTIQGISNQTYATESSPNLSNWSAFATNIAPANSFNVTDSTSTNILLRYYRARQDL